MSELVFDFGSFGDGGIMIAIDYTIGEDGSIVRVGEPTITKLEEEACA